MHFYVITTAEINVSFVVDRQIEINTQIVDARQLHYYTVFCSRNAVSNKSHCFSDSCVAGMGKLWLLNT